MNPVHLVLIKEPDDPLCFVSPMVVLLEDEARGRKDMFLDNAEVLLLVQGGRQKNQWEGALFRYR